MCSTSESVGPKANVVAKIEDSVDTVKDTAMKIDFVVG